MKCKKCGNKEATALYYKTIFSGEFNLSVNKNGEEEIDWGGYNTADDFISSMLNETGKRKLLGCELCFE